VPAPDDERFESYLKQFRPVTPPPLQAEMPTRSRRNRLLAAASLAAALVLIVAAFSLRVRPHRTSGAATAEPLQRPEPLTLGSANALLANAPSFKAAIDKVSFPPPTAPSSPGKTSALAVLSKEKSRL
jgi:hypothetical protein